VRLKTLLLLALAGVLTLAGVPAGAEGPRKAGADYSYEDMNHHFGAPNTSTGIWDTRDAYVFKLKRGERFVSVSIADDEEGPVAGAIVQRVWDYESEGASVGHSVTHFDFCGETEEPVKVVRRIDVEIVLKKGTCQDGTPSAPTEGHMFLEFFEKR